MTRFLVAPVVALAVLLTGTPALAATTIPPSCVEVDEDFVPAGAKVCTPWK